MRYILDKKPKSPIILEGFPGFGLIGTIVTEFLIKHLDAKKIGSIRMEEIPPIVAIHGGEPVEPLGMFYDKKHNLMILHALSNVQGFEWEIAEMLGKVAKVLKAKEVISVEGVGSDVLKDGEEPRVFYMNGKNKFDAKKVAPLKEGIVMGVTGALLLKKGLKVTSIFVETHSALPDSRAAAKVIEVLDKYLKLGVDYKPLIEKAEKFESKLKDIISKSKDAAVTGEKKRQTYFG